MLPAVLVAKHWTLITLYSVTDPGSPNPVRQMQPGLAEAALTGASVWSRGTRETGQTVEDSDHPVRLPSAQDGTGPRAAVHHGGRLIDA